MTITQEMELRTEENVNPSEQATDEESAEENEEQVDLDINTGWVDSISKILKSNKPKKKKTLVLSKAKVLNQVPKTIKTEVKPAGFEVETQDGKIVEQKVQVIPKEIPNTTQKSGPKRKKNLPNICIKPNPAEAYKERLLARVATKGVVQLFNAVRTQQNVIKDKLNEAGPLEVKKDKALKSIDKKSFLNVLMGEKSPSESSAKVATAQKKEKSESSTWNVFRDDFMMSAKMKDWDKELEDENETLMETE